MLRPHLNYKPIPIVTKYFPPKRTAVESTVVGWTCLTSKSLSEVVNSCSSEWKWDFNPSFDHWDTCKKPTRTSCSHLWGALFQHPPRTLLTEGHGVPEELLQSLPLQSRSILRESQWRQPPMLYYHYNFSFERRFCFAAELLGGDPPPTDG